MIKRNTEGTACRLSVVAPAFNEALNLPLLIEEVSGVLRPLGEPWEFLIVNDASTDESLEILETLTLDYPELRIISLLRRSGQTAAIDAGIHAARGRFVALIDADLQNVPAEIPRLLDILEHTPCDLVNGWRNERRDPWIRLLSTRVANGVRNRLTRETIRDSACGLKVFRADCARQVKLFNGMHRFLPTLFKIEGFRVVEVPVSHRHRVAGRTKYNIRNRLFKGLRDTLAVRWMQRYALRYETREYRPVRHEKEVHCG